VLGHTRAGGPVHADGVHLVVEGDGAVLFGQADNALDRADGAAHGVDGFEGDDLGRIEGQSRQLGLEVDQVIVLEDDLAGLGMLDALDH
jgi:hypothetical protein